MSILNIAAYKFVSLQHLEPRRRELRQCCDAHQLRGTILLAPEGLNLFVAGAAANVERLLAALRSWPELADLKVKRSFSDDQPFRRMLIRIKREVIAFGVEGIDPRRRTSPKISAEELKRWIDEGRDFTLLDVRNDYEIKVGTFRGAEAIGVNHFRDFPAAAAAAAPQIPRDKPVVMFCTGGIRCEKAGPFLEREGYLDVLQLEGGILGYFERCGGAHYEGQCFVFDRRVAVDPRLQETRYAMCYVCQAVLTPAEQESPEYVPEQSCPHCHQSPQRRRRSRLESMRRKIRGAVEPLPGCEPYDNIRPLKIPASVDGLELLDALDQLLPYVGREAWRRSCEAGCVREQGRPLDARSLVRAGQLLLHIDPQITEPPVSGAIELLYEDDALLAVDKPAPLPVHPSGRFNRNTLVSILNTAYAPEKVRCAHRIDANTSGLVLLTRRRAAASVLQPMFDRGEVAKRYLARVHGHPEQDSFQCGAPIDAVARPVGLRACADNGLAARTEFRVLRRDDDGQALLEVRPLTGRTNQIRVHLWHLGHSIVGDPSYLPDRRHGGEQTLPLGAPPMCLHAWKLRLRHPMTGEALDLAAPPPAWTGLNGES